MGKKGLEHKIINFSGGNLKRIKKALKKAKECEESDFRIGYRRNDIISRKTYFGINASEGMAKWVPTVERDLSIQDNFQTRLTRLDIGRYTKIICDIGNKGVNIYFSIDPLKFPEKILGKLFKTSGIMQSKGYNKGFISKEEITQLDRWNDPFSHRISGVDQRFESLSKKYG